MSNHGTVLKVMSSVAMASELAIPTHSERNAVNMGLLKYTDAGEKEGIFVDWFEPREFITFENFVYPSSSETQAHASSRASW